jgi:hypothetical protein
MNFLVTLCPLLLGSLVALKVSHVAFGDGLLLTTEPCSE